MQVRQRRRARSFPPEVLSAVRELLASGASAREVLEALGRRQDDGQLYHGDEPLALPSEGTVKNIAREMTRDESAAWTLEDSGVEEAGLVLRVLGAVSRESRGRIRHLTKREAHLAAVFLAATPGVEGGNAHRQAWKAYVQAREYLTMAHRGDDLAPHHMSMADRAAIDAGLEYLPGGIDPVVKETKRG